MRISRAAGAMSIATLFVAATAFAQAPSPPQSTSTPSSASSPSQREATSSPAKESSTSAPSDATTAHQREAMGNHQTMKQCMDKQASMSAGKSQSDMTKACEEQMKKQKNLPAVSQGPTATPKGNQSPTTTAPPK
jgi:hypothetical protein